jgi:alpha-L-fucosidase 2
LERAARGLALLFVMVIAACAPTQAASRAPLSLWFDSPAADWEREGLPIGNGAMGAMIMGGVSEDRVQFNEKTLWTGGPGSVEGYDAGWPQGSSAREVAAIQRELARTGRLAPEAAARRLGRPMRGYGHYQSMGELVLAFPARADGWTNYRRELDIENAIGRVGYERGGVRYLREYYASYPDGVIVVRVSADQPGEIAFTASLAVPDNRTSRVLAEGGRITGAGALNDNGMKWESQVQVLAEGGTVSAGENGTVRVENANAATLILSTGANYAADFPTYRGVDPHAAITARVDAAAAKGHARLLADHQADYRALFDRVSLDIGQGETTLPTNAQREAYRGAAASPTDRALEALYFQYGRYLLISSSRAGSLPANLQGVWNNSATPPWNADYHVNINLQMNYWLAETTNLAETTPPLFDFIDSLVEPGRIAARRIVGADGWTLFLNTNIFGFTGVIDWPTAFWQPEAGAWLAQHYYEHYRFTRDEAFLRTRAYPVMKGAAQFWLDALVEDREGRLVVSPSYSPEQGDFGIGVAMSQQIVWDLFRNVSEAAEITGDTAFKIQIDAARARLDPGLRIGSWGQLQEWREDWDDRSNEHRHASHLFALHPGNQISPAATPAFADAARVSLRARGDGGTGWSKAWKINFWARLLDGDHAHLMLAEQLKASTLPNLWDTHPPFQIDGNFGATAGVAEMLLQSQNDEIHILPALPRVWPTGAVRGLRARGDVVVDIVWADGAAREVTLRIGRAGPIAVRASLFEQPFEIVESESGRSVETEGEGAQRTFAGAENRRYVIRRPVRGRTPEQLGVESAEFLSQTF